MNTKEIKKIYVLVDCDDNYNDIPLAAVEKFDDIM